MSLFADLAPIIGGVVAGGASLLGSRAQSRAAERAGETSERIYTQQRADLAPYREVGYASLNDLRDIYLTGKKPYTASPGYDFRLQEGVDAMDRSAAARGMLLSGAQRKRLNEYGQGLATEDYDRNFNRLAKLAGFGGDAVSAGNQAGGEFAVNVGNAGIEAGRARASGYEGVGSAINQGVNNQLTLEALRRYPIYRGYP